MAKYFFAVVFEAEDEEDASELVGKLADVVEASDRPNGRTHGEASTNWKRLPGLPG